MTAQELLARSRLGPKDHLRAFSLSLELAGPEERRRFIWLFRTGLVPPEERTKLAPPSVPRSKWGHWDRDDWSLVRAADLGRGHERSPRRASAEYNPSAEAALRAWEDSEGGLDI